MSTDSTTGRGRGGARRRLVAAVMSATMVVSVGCGSGDPVNPASAPDTLSNGSPSIYPAPVVRTSGRAADVVLDWMDLQTGLLQRERLGPPVGTRVIGYASLALAEGVRLATPGVAALPIEGLDLPDVPAGNLDPGVTGAAATATVTRSLIPGLEAQRSVDLLEAAQVAAAGERGAVDLDEAVAFGNAIGEAVLALAVTDGYDGLPQRIEGELPAEPGAWEPTPPAREFPLEPYWGTLRPLVVADADCPVQPPVPYDETPGSAFWNEGMAVADAVANLTDDQFATTLYWRDRPGTSYLPLGHWVRIAAGVLESGVPQSGDGAGAGGGGGEQAVRGETSLVDAATAYAALGVAGYDAFIANWKVKYDTNVLRPITYLQRVLDPAWKAKITTPPFPAYPSGHSTGSSAAATVLTELLGEQSFTDTAGEFEGYAPRSYPSFTAAADEASISRLYGGIHFPMDLNAGKQQGVCIGSSVLARLGLGGAAGE